MYNCQNFTSYSNEGTGAQSFTAHAQTCHFSASGQFSGPEPLIRISINGSGLDVRACIRVSVTVCAVVAERANCHIFLVTAWKFTYI